MAFKITFDIDERSVTNDKFYPLYTNQARHLHLYGGAGSSKSRFTAQKYLLRVIYGMQQGVKHRIVCLRKTQPAVRKSVYTVFKHYHDEWGLAPIMNPHPSDLTFRFINGSEIICSGLDDPMKLKSIEGVTAFWLEEATEFTPEDFRQVDLRLRGDIGTYKQLTYTYNPVDIAHHLYKRIHQKVGDEYTGSYSNNTFLHHSTYKDNRFIDSEYAKILEDLEEEDPGYHKIYTRGLWGALRLLIYGGCYRVLPDSEWPDHFDEECYGLDFGFNNPTALVHIGVLDRIPYVREIIYQTKLTNTQLIERMREENVSDRIPIYADSAEPARIEEISNEGFDCRSATEAKKPNAVKARIDFCQRSNFKVHEDSSNLITELTAYKWKEDKKTGDALDEPVKFLDHACNGFEYGFFEAFRIGLARPGFKFVK
jgi:phage terminase large subunit